MRNINTGASMWLAGAVGLACGAGQGTLAVTAAVMIVTVILVISAIERRWHPEDQSPE